MVRGTVGQFLESVGGRPGQKRRPMQERLVQLLLGSRLLAVGLLAVGLVSLALVSEGTAQQVIRGIRPAIAAGDLINDVEEQTEESENSSGGATLKTDPDLESILKKAERYQQDGNYSVACQLWQAVLERSGDTLYSLDNRTYYSMIEQVEKTLAGLPPEGLQVYRIAADAAARQILAQASRPDDPQALNEVVRKYFVSSVGDDAAFALACQALDRFDFVGALRLLKKIQKQHPDSSVPGLDVASRLALCQILMGDLGGAKDTLTGTNYDEANTDQRIQAVRELLAKAKSGESAGFEGVQAANFRNYKLGPALPADFFTKDLTAVWQSYLEPNELYNAGDRTDRVLGRVSAAAMEETVNSQERAQVEKWQELGWRPTGELLLVGGKVIFRSPIDVSAWSTGLGERSVWRSLWMSSYEADDATRMSQMVRMNYGGRAGGRSRKPETTGQTLSFGDRIHSQMSVNGDLLCTIEGQHPDTVSHRMGKNQGIPWNSTFRRTRNNFLCAYEVSTGRLLWTLPAANSPGTPQPAPPADQGAKETEFLQSGGFMGPPVQFGNALLVPVNQGGAINIYALDVKRQGRTLWKTFLCDEPDTGAEPWAPIQLSLDGSDLFAPTGMGVVFVLDPATGAIRFAQRYERAGVKNDTFRNIGYQINRMDFDGWSEDVIIPYGRQMICFASDANRVFAIDRNSGQMIWETDMNPLGQKLDYVLGIANDKLYAAGRQTIIAFDLRGEGRMLWGGDDLFGGALSGGKGILTSDGLYVPVNDTVWKFGLEGKGGRADKQAAVHVALPIGAPVGNLLSDGERLWTHQGTRLVALGPEEAVQEQPAESGGSEQE
jgi:outer membrane protein assembly factor BamB